MAISVVLVGEEGEGEEDEDDAGDATPNGGAEEDRRGTGRTGVNDFEPEEQERGVGGEVEEGRQAAEENAMPSGGVRGGRRRRRNGRGRTRVRERAGRMKGQ